MNPLNNPYNEDGTPNTELSYGSLHNTLYVLDNNVTQEVSVQELATKVYSLMLLFIQLEVTRSTSSSRNST